MSTGGWGYQNSRRTQWDFLHPVWHVEVVGRSTTCPPIVCGLTRLTPCRRLLIGATTGGLERGRGVITVVAVRIAFAAGVRGGLRVVLRLLVLGQARDRNDRTSRAKRNVDDIFELSLRLPMCWKACSNWRVRYQSGKSIESLTCTDHGIRASHRLLPVADEVAVGHPDLARYG